MTVRPLPAEEPSADMRQWASSVRGMYVALVQEGFAPAEALALTTEFIRSVMGTKK